jgi:hypothetical protein
MGIKLDAFRGFGGARVFNVPKGHRENSPAFQRWGGVQKAVSPEETADLNSEWEMKSAEFHPSLRDFGLSASIPSLEKAGLFSFVSPGHLILHGWTGLDRTFLTNRGQQAFCR